YGNATVEGFSGVPDLGSIVFTFTRPAAAITELAYDRLGDLQNAVPFLAKIQNYPFDTAATAGSILNAYITDISITGPPWSRVFLKRIRQISVNGQPQYIFLFAYNNTDVNGNYLNTVNVGIATVTQTSGPTVSITSVGSNTVAGVAPTWLDEFPSTYTSDNYGV